MVKTPSYILELEIRPSQQEAKMIDKKFEVARQIYNASLSYALKALKRVQHDKIIIELLKEPGYKERNRKIRDRQMQLGYSEYQLHHIAKNFRNYFQNMIGSQECQKLATRAFQTVEKMHFHQAKQVHFYRYDEFPSIEGKSNSTGLRFDGEYICWFKMKFKPVIKRNDRYAMIALNDRTKYVRILTKIIRGKKRYFVQLIQEGCPPQKHIITKGTVGLDIGTSTLAYSSDSNVGLVELAPDIIKDSKKLARIERAMDRSRRAANPDNYNSDGTVSKGKHKWYKSKRYLKLQAKRQELNRKLTDKRKQSHEQLANYVLSLGDDVRVETMSYKGLQKRSRKTSKKKTNGRMNSKKRFGRTIGNRAPAMLLEIINRKLCYINKTVQKIDTFKVRASQFNHLTGSYEKKDLSERWNYIDNYKIQRDMYSSFLIANTADSLDIIDVDKCNNNWHNFVIMHDKEIQRIKNSNNKTMLWYIA